MEHRTFLKMSPWRAWTSNSLSIHSNFSSMTSQLYYIIMLLGLTCTLTTDSFLTLFISVSRQGTTFILRKLWSSQHASHQPISVFLHDDSHISRLEPLGWGAYQQHKKISSLWPKKRLWIRNPWCLWWYCWAKLSEMGWEKKNRSNVLGRWVGFLPFLNC